MSKLSRDMRVKEVELLCGLWVQSEATDLNEISESLSLAVQRRSLGVTVDRAVFFVGTRLPESATRLRSTYENPSRGSGPNACAEAQNVEMVV